MLWHRREKFVCVGIMPTLPHPMVWMTALTLIGGGTHALAQLPTLKNVDRFGYFAIHSDRNVELGITSSGTLRFMPALGGNLRSSFTDGKYAVEIQPAMTTTAADGKVTRRRIATSSLDSPDEPTEKLEQTTITGEVTGGAGFEFKITQNNGVLVLGGHHTNPQETTTPYQFALEVKVFPLITSSKLETLDKLNNDAQNDHKARRDLRDLLRDFRDDRITVRRTDGSETRYLLAEKPEGGATAINGPGIKEVEIESSIYQARRVIITAETGSTMTLSPSRDEMLLTGFTLAWTRDPSTDPEGKARLAITAR